MLHMFYFHVIGNIYCHVPNEVLKRIRDSEKELLVFDELLRSHGGVLAIWKKNILHHRKMNFGLILADYFKNLALMG